MSSESCRTPARDNREPFTVGSTSPFQAILGLLDELDPHQLDNLGAHIEQKRLTRSSSVSTEQLTEREKEVLLLVASGYNRKEIGRALKISACTAAKHISNIYRKLGVSTIAEATRVALVDNIAIGG